MIHSARSWAERLEMFSPFHALVVGLCAALILGAVALGRRWRDGPLEMRLRLGWCAFALTLRLVHTIAELTPARWDPARSLPLQLCDLAAWVAPFALLVQARLPRALLYFWGLGLSTQAFITPIQSLGWAAPAFWFFWLGHLGIVGSAVYDLAVRGFRPSFADYRRVFVASLAYLALVVCVNELTGANYGFVGRGLPGTRTLADSLGPWPLRVVWIALLGLSFLFLLWAVWPLARLLRAKRSATR